jgi:hypothetical protein
MYKSPNILVLIPSVIQSSRPYGAAVAAKKYNVGGPTLVAVMYPGSELVMPGAMSFKRMVPALVPSEIQSSRPART